MEGYNLSKRANGEDLTAIHGLWMGPKASGHGRYHRSSMLDVANIPTRMLDDDDVYAPVAQPRMIRRHPQSQPQVDPDYAPREARAGSESSEEAPGAMVGPEEAAAEPAAAAASTSASAAPAAAAGLVAGLPLAVVGQTVGDLVSRGSVPFGTPLGEVVDLVSSSDEGVRAARSWGAARGTIWPVAVPAFPTRLLQLAGHSQPGQRAALAAVGARAGAAGRRRVGRRSPSAIWRRGGRRRSGDELGYPHGAPRVRVWRRVHEEAEQLRNDEPPRYYCLDAKSVESR